LARYRIDLAYDGTAYCGWQIQPNGPSVQEAVQTALKSLCGEPCPVHGSGRTDQGVHARRQVAHFDVADPRPADALKKGLNAILPPDIRIVAVRAVSPTFHARLSAVGKEYRYFIWNADILPPFIRRYRAHIRRKLDIGRMREAAAILQGRHDFAAFTANPNRDVESTTRNLSTLRVTRRGPEIVITARGEGFLYKMVRSLAGFLIRVGEGAVPPEEARAILHSRVRTARVPTAPPEGLFLWKVSY
jgi:tRNA pseudouridine38-40 synthase